MKNKSDIYDRVGKIIAKEIGIDEKDIMSDMNFRLDLTADSLQIFKIIIDLEDEFGLSISDDDAEKIEKVEDAVNYIVKNY
ncbi:MAG TPA: acyl carrier protein [Clostridia bacterium]|jgi:acyl carrier protein|nr:acyl carrier protein [Clostridia bacterium]